MNALLYIDAYMEMMNEYISLKTLTKSVLILRKKLKSNLLVNISYIYSVSFLK